jgi:hypothetical protein
LIALRGRLGIVNAAHLVAQALDPTQGSATRLMLSAGGGERARRAPRGRGRGRCGRVALARGTLAPEPLDPPRIERLHHGVPEVLFEADAQETPTALAAPTDDAPGMAQWIQRATDGSVPVPVPALSLVAAVPLRRRQRPGLHPGQGDRRPPRRPTRRLKRP